METERNSPTLINLPGCPVKTWQIRIDVKMISFRDSQNEVNISLMVSMQHLLVFDGPETLSL